MSEDQANPLSLAEALPLEMARVRDICIPNYLSIGPNGAFAVAMMRAELDAAARAIASGDVVKMIQAYKELKEIES